MPILEFNIYYEINHNTKRCIDAYNYVIHIIIYICIWLYSNMYYVIICNDHNLFTKIYLIYKYT